MLNPTQKKYLLYFCPGLTILALGVFCTIYALSDSFIGAFGCASVIEGIGLLVIAGRIDAQE